MIKVIAKNVANILYPLRCAGCDGDIDCLSEVPLCRTCESRIKRNPKPYCRKCGRASAASSGICPECQRSVLDFDRAWSACLYEGVLKNIVHSFKYKGKRALAAVMSDILMNFVINNPEVAAGIDVVTFVPLRRSAEHQRGFNQSEILAQTLSAKSGIPCGGFLKKEKRTRRQNELGRNERLENLKGAFAIKPGAAVKGCGILLIDDVMTTGATLSECALALKSGGASTVKCLTLARGM